MRNQTSGLQIPSSDALPLSHRDCGEQGPLWISNMTHVLLTDRISIVDSIMFVNLSINFPQKGDKKMVRT